jgi:hypothetical protein
MALANILRTDADAHRPLPADSELVQAIAVLARAQQDAVWNRGQLSNQLRSHLKQYFPAALAAFQVRGVGLDSREARAVLAVAPDPTTAAKLTTTQLSTVLRKAGRQRNIDVWAQRLRGLFTGEQLQQLPLVEQAMGRQTQAMILQLDAACRAADELAAATAEAFAQHDQRTGRVGHATIRQLARTDECDQQAARVGSPRTRRRSATRHPRLRAPR